MDEKETTGAATQRQLSVDEAYSVALEHFNAKRFVEADRLCTAILQSAPGHIDALNMLGCIAQNTGKHEMALKLFQRGLGMDGERVVLHYNAGISLYVLGRVEAAVTALQTALSLDPGNASIKNQLNMMLSKPKATVSADGLEGYLQKAGAFFQSGRLDEALGCYETALEIEPDNIVALTNIGCIFDNKGEVVKAAAAFEKVISIQPDSFAAHYNLSQILYKQNRIEEAIDYYKKTVAIKPDCAEAWFNLGNIFREHGQLEEAIVNYQQAVAAKPGFADAHVNLGIAMQESGLLSDAIAEHRNAIAIAPDNAMAHCNLSGALMLQKSPAEAMVSIRQARRLKPREPFIQTQYVKIIGLLGFLGEYEGAVKDMAAVVPSMLSSPKESMSALNQMAYLAPYFGLDDKVVIEVLTVLGREFAQTGEDVAADKIAPDSAVRILNIGYISPDFRDHPVSQLVTPVLESHDKTRCAIYCYSLTYVDDEKDSYSMRIKSAVDVYRKLSGVTVSDAGKRIRGDKIDILVDLTGYLEGGRPAILAARPAPIQIHWYMHLAGMPAPFIDYTISDKVMMPDEALRADVPPLLCWFSANVKIGHSA